MSCELPSVQTISRCALVSLLLAAVCPSTAFAQPSVCHGIRSGESATQLARRLTGDGRNKYQPWFQIMDASSRFVPKSQYDRIRSEWRVCIARDTHENPVQAAVQPVTQGELRDVPVAARERPRPAAATTIPAMSGVDLSLLWIGAAVVLPLCGLKVADDYMARRKTVLLVMRHFAHRFVREFERPLIQQPAELPLRARLRLRPARRRVDILLAPGEGRRYPNLSDHRQNVEYDVMRIVGLLGDESFVREPLYTHAEWVVVPFRFNLGRKHTGVT